MTLLPGAGLPPPPRSRELEAALDAARRAGALVLGHLGSAAFELKADRSIVTVADRESEALVRSTLEAAVPGVPVLGEETASEEGVRALVSLEAAWVVDPIDGTAAYAVGLPTFGVSIGLLSRGQPVLGVFHLPRSDELYACDREGPSFHGTRELGGCLTPETVDERAFLCVPSDVHLTHDLRFPGKARSLGSTALHVLLVARGAAYAALLAPRAWDVAAAVPILRRAGGDLFDLGTGRALDFAAWLREGGPERDLLACSPGALPMLRKCVRRRV